MLKLSKRGITATNAENKIDAHFAGLINKKLGPLAVLHSLKRQQAETGGNGLVTDDADRAAILSRAGELDATVLALDTERRRMKEAVRSAATSDDIAAILTTLGKVA